MRCIATTIFFFFSFLFSFVRGKNNNKDKKHTVPNPSMQLSPTFLRAVKMRIPLLRKKYLLVLMLCRFLPGVRHKLSLKYQLPIWVKVPKITIMEITNICYDKGQIKVFLQKLIYQFPFLRSSEQISARVSCPNSRRHDSLPQTEQLTLSF